MNDARRKRLSECIELLKDVRERLESIKDDEQDAFDNTPEALQNTETEEFLDAMHEGIESIDATIEALEQ